MRAIVILLASITVAGSAMAQLSPLAPPATPAPAASAAPTAVPTMIGGKFVVGYDGRGDYLKNEQLAKQRNVDGTVKAPATSAPVDAMSAADKSKAGGAMQAMNTAPVTQPVPTTPAPATTSAAPAKLRSDTSLSSDTSKTKAALSATMPAASTTTAAATPAAPQPAGPSYNPMVLIGGRIQR